MTSDRAPSGPDFDDLHVVFTFPYALTTTAGGPRHCLEFARHMKGMGARVTVLAIATDPDTLEPWPEAAGPPISAEARKMLDGLDLEIRRVRGRRKYWLLDGFPMARAVRELVDETRVDAVISWAQEAYRLPDLLRARGITFSMVAAGSYARMFPRGNSLHARAKRLFFDHFIGRTLRRADLVFAASHFTREEVIERLRVERDLVYVAHCGVARSFRADGRGYDGKVDRFLYVGRLARGKGIFDTLDALGELRRRRDDPWTLRVAGAGDARRVQAAAEARGIGDRVELLGHLSSADLVGELRAADVGIVPTHRESFGLAIAEAQSTGLPIAAYAVGAVPEVVVDGSTGWLVPAGRTKALANALEDALDRPEEVERRGRAAAARIDARFRWEPSTRAVLTLLRGARAR